MDGAESHYEDTGGAGTPVVFAHGLLWSGAMYRFQIEALRGAHRCIPFDFRGQGRSPVAKSGYDMDSLARDAAQLIMFGRTFLRDPSKAALRDSLRQELLRNDVRGSVRALRGVRDRAGLMDDLRAIRTPTLVASGEEDVAVPPACSRRTAERIPGARFVLLPRAGHTSSLEQPDAVTGVLREFFASVN